jgi:ubiquinone/menaquinone biosynthesis C-methylase UbiE
LDQSSQFDVGQTAEQIAINLHCANTAICIRYIKSQSAIQMSYSLGSSKQEQTRLIRQVALYGDTNQLTFKGTSVCEFGCGAGANLWIAKQVAPKTYYGVDNLPEQLAAAQSRADALGLRNVKLLARDASDSGLAKHTVDAVFCRLLLIHQPEPSTVIDEMIRVLRPGGRLVIHEPYGPGHFCSPGKPNLVKCFRARTQFAYGDGKGTPDVAHDLYRLLMNAGLVDVQLRPHVITAFGNNHKRARDFLRHWIQIIEPISEQLIAADAVTSNELQRASEEAKSVPPELLICHTMWCAEATKPLRYRD